jgi:hypothetical protein
VGPKVLSFSRKERRPYATGYPSLTCRRKTKDLRVVGYSTSYHFSRKERSLYETFGEWGTNRSAALQERNKPQVFFLVLSEKETREKIEGSACDLRC